MSKSDKLDTNKGVDEMIRLLSLDEYRDVDNVINILKIGITQIHVKALLSMPLTLDYIASKVGLNEKTIRMYRDAEQCPNRAHAIAIENLYLKERDAWRANRNKLARYK